MYFLLTAQGCRINFAAVLELRIVADAWSIKSITSGYSVIDFNVLFYLCCNV